LPVHMFRAPDRHQRSPGAPRPASGWGFPRSPYGGSSRSYSPYSPGSPGYSPGSNRGYRDGSPAGFGNGSGGFGDTFGSGSRGFGGPMRRRGDGFRRPQSLSPTSAPNFKVRIRGWIRTGNAPVQKYFSPSMMQDPWKNLQPVTTVDAAAARQIT
uniref:M-phase specific PLK1 interacting protein n=1 Tax=Maylandia zebra TaxID=106582 RepID=A0A3P9CVK9_9CICH